MEKPERDAALPAGRASVTCPRWQAGWAKYVTLLFRAYRLLSWMLDAGRQSGKGLICGVCRLEMSLYLGFNRRAPGLC
jgi:hypothetical protein